VKPECAEAVVHLMVAKDPHQSADIILGFLMGVNGARTGAIFWVDGGLRLFVGHNIAQEVLDWTAACWNREHKALQQGRLSRSEEHFLVPVLRGTRVAALVYLTAPQLDLESIGEVSDLIADAAVRIARQPAVSAVESYLEETPAKEIERRKLLILLDRYEWNVARVARELQVTRTTVYKRLEVFGIPRKRIAKEDRPLPTSG
jgi:hypothetical protein